MASESGDESQKIKEWQDNLPDSTRVIRASGWGRWEGVQVISYSHRMRQFEMYSNHLAFFASTTKATRYELRKGRSFATKVIAPNSLSIIPCFETYIAETDGSMQGDVGMLMSPEFLKKVSEEEGLGSSPELVAAFGEDDSSLSSLLRLLDNDLAENSPAGRIYGDSLIRASAMRILHLWSTQPKTILKPTAASKVEIQQTIDFLNDNMDQDITLAKAAEHVGFSPSHLHRAFKAATGERLHEHLIRIRLERAKTLLKATNLTVSEIAIEVGFSDQGHLARQFRRAFQTSPAEYRRQIRE